MFGSADGRSVCRKEKTGDEGRPHLVVRNGLPDRLSVIGCVEQGGIERKDAGRSGLSRIPESLCSSGGFRAFDVRFGSLAGTGARRYPGGEDAGRIAGAGA